MIETLTKFNDMTITKLGLTNYHLEGQEVVNAIINEVLFKNNSSNFLCDFNCDFALLSAYTHRIRRNQTFPNLQYRNVIVSVLHLI